MRVYDKGVQSREEPPGVHFRAELETKGRAAYNRWIQLYTAKEPQLNMAHWIKDFAASRNLAWVSDRVAFARKPLRLKVFASTPETSIIWLKAQVAPALAKLINEGLIDEAEKALGYRLSQFTE